MSQPAVSKHLRVLKEAGPVEARGWDACLGRLAADATPAELWNERFAVYSAAFEAIVGSQEGPPTGYKGKEAGVSR